MRMVHAIQVVGAATTIASPATAQSANTSLSAWVGMPVSEGIVARNSIAPVAARETISDVSPAITMLRSRFAALRTMPDGWDGAGSYAPRPTVANYAARLLDTVISPLIYIEAPMIVPVADGGIQAEWYSPTHRFEMYFDADGEVSAWSNNRETGVEREEDGTDAIQLLVDWARERESDKLNNI